MKPSLSAMFDNPCDTVKGLVEVRLLSFTVV